MWNPLRLVVLVVLVLSTLMAEAKGSGTKSDALALHAFTLFVEGYSHQLNGVEPNGDCKDLDFLGKFTQNAKIVGLGESRHSAHEFLQMKRRMVECLVAHGFTDVLIEAGLPYTEKLNNYVKHGTGDVRKLVGGMAYWSLYDDDEFIGLLDWLRSYNARAKPGKVVNLLGIDMQDPRPGLEATLAYFKTVDPSFRAEIAGRKASFSLYRSTANVVALTIAYKKLSDEQFRALSGSLSLMERQLDKRRSEYIARSSEGEYKWVREELATVLQAHRVYSLTREKTFKDLFEAREQAMAQNLEWQVSNGGEGRRYILLSHNNHVAKAMVYGGVPGAKNHGFKPLGMIIARKWPGKYVALGASFYQASGHWQAWQNDAQWMIPDARPDSLDAVLASTGDKLFVVDLRSLAAGSPAGVWAKERHILRSEGGITAVVPADAYDGLLFVRSLGQAHYTKAAIARFDAMGPPVPRTATVDRALLLKVQGDYRLPNKTVVEFRMMNDTLYALWNQWKFRVFAKSDNEFALRVEPAIAFKFERTDDGSVKSMQIRRGEKDWQDTTRIE